MANRNRDAFTLVEMLVVITIMGILMALLLAAIQQVRESARRVQCANNQRNLGSAVLNYEQAKKHLPGVMNMVPWTDRRPLTRCRKPRCLAGPPCSCRYVGEADKWEGMTAANGNVIVAGWRAGNPPSALAVLTPPRFRVNLFVCPNDLDAATTVTLLSYAANMGVYKVAPPPGNAIVNQQPYAKFSPAAGVVTITTPGIFQDYFYHDPTVGGVRQIVGRPARRRRFP